MANMKYLYELRRVLNDVQPNEFSWNTWYRENVPDCGTIACVAGHGTLKSTMLRDAGLELLKDYATFDGCIVACLGFLSGHGRFARMFDITLAESNALFYADFEEEYQLQKEILGGDTECPSNQCVADFSSDVQLDMAKRVLDSIITRYENKDS